VFTKLPGEHGTQKPSNERPQLSRSSPPGHLPHASHSARPLALWYVSVAHAMHAAAPAEGWCWPAAQSVHDVLPADEYLPAAHLPQ
jgi:hypothetical protein